VVGRHDVLQFRGEKSQDKANGRIFQGCSGGLPVSRWFIIAGLVLVALGLILHYAPWLLNWFGRLPGDIRTEGEQTRVFIPITSMIIVSLVLTLVLNLFSR
jgi:hypothetical protein